MPPSVISPYEPGEIVFVVLILVEPTAEKVFGSGKAGSVGRLGVSLNIPPTGTGPEYVYVLVGVFAGKVIFPETVPPPITILPFTSTLPPIIALDPTERIVDPGGSGEGRVVVLAADILPVTILLLASCMIPPLTILVGFELVPIIKLAVDLTR